GAPVPLVGASWKQRARAGSAGARPQRRSSALVGGRACRLAACDHGRASHRARGAGGAQPRVAARRPLGGGRWGDRRARPRLWAPWVPMRVSDALPDAGRADEPLARALITQWSFAE